MTTTAATTTAAAGPSWMPPSGCYDVRIGSSLGRALNARKLRGEAAPPKRSKVPENDFYSFRYNFKPPSIDPAKPGSIEVKKGKDRTTVTVERPSTQPGESHVFLGSEVPAKEWECVLIYDEVSDTFTLEKLDSHLNLSFERKAMSIPRQSTASPAAPPPQKASTSARTYADELEKELLGTDDDADGDIDDAINEILPDTSAYRQEEEEEEEGYIPPEPPKPAPPKPSPPKPARQSTKQPKGAKGPKQAPQPMVLPAAASHTQAAPLARSSPKGKVAVITKASEAAVHNAAARQPKSAPAPPMTASPISQPTPSVAPAIAAAAVRGKKSKRQPAQARPQQQPPAAPPEPSSHEHLAGAEVEDLEFGRPTKRARRSPIPTESMEPHASQAGPSASTPASSHRKAPQSSGLALPGTSAVYTPPPALSPASRPVAKATPSSSSHIPSRHNTTASATHTSPSLPHADNNNNKVINNVNKAATATATEASDSDSDWDVVVPATSGNTAQQNNGEDDEDGDDDFDIFGDVLSEAPVSNATATTSTGRRQQQQQQQSGATDGTFKVDVNALERELNLEMQNEDSDEDFLAQAVSDADEDMEPVALQVEEPMPMGMPIPLKQLAGGVYGSDEEDEYSSSDESDDE